MRRVDERVPEVLSLPSTPTRPAQRARPTFAVVAIKSPDGGTAPPGLAAGIGEDAAAAGYAALIWTFLGFALSAFGTVTSRMPSLNVAVTFVASTVVGSEKLRVNFP